MADIKISELEPTTDLEGLYTIGADKNNLSKKVSLQFLKDAANYANEQGDYAKQAGDTVNGNVGVSDYPEFSASKSYVIGDIVRYNGVLYSFTANHAASAWNGSDVKATSINAITSEKLTELGRKQLYGIGISKFSEGASGASIDIPFSYNVGDALYWDIEDSVKRTNYIYLLDKSGNAISFGSGNKGSILLDKDIYAKFRAYAASNDSANGRKVTIFAKALVLDSPTTYKKATTMFNGKIDISLSNKILSVNCAKLGTGAIYLYFEDGYIAINEQNIELELGTGMVYIYCDITDLKIKITSNKDDINKNDLFIAGFYADKGNIALCSWISPICELNGISVNYAATYSDLNVKPSELKADVKKLQSEQLYGIGISKYKEGTSGASIDIPFSYNVGDTLYWDIEDSVVRTNIIYLFKKDGTYVVVGTSNSGSVVLKDDDYSYFRAYANSDESANGRKVTIFAKASALEISANANAIKAMSAKIFQRVGCIGDSYTAGYVKVGDEITYGSPNNAWPHYMEGLTNHKYENWGVSGSTAKGWVLGAANLNLVKKQGNKCQAYIIGLMINDKANVDWNNYYTPVGVKADIGTDNDSYYAYYYKLIQEVVSVNPDAKIFCNTCPKWGANDAYNIAVRDIVEHCHGNGQNVFLCDLASEKYAPYFKNQTFVADAISGHYTSIGYEYMAECLVNILSDVINNNISEFQNVTFIPFDEIVA